MSVDVLIVDDDAAVREALVQSLELAEFAARAAGSFIEAKDHITPDFPGVILSDIRMPGRDGFHLLGYTPGTGPRAAGDPADRARATSRWRSRRWGRGRSISSRSPARRSIS